MIEDNKPFDEYDDKSHPANDESIAEQAMGERFLPEHTNWEQDSLSTKQSLNIETDNLKYHSSNLESHNFKYEMLNIYDPELEEEPIIHVKDNYIPKQSSKKKKNIFNNIAKFLILLLGKKKKYELEIDDPNQLNIAKSNQLSFDALSKNHQGVKKVLKQHLLKNKIRLKRKINIRFKIPINFNKAFSNKYVKKNKNVTNRVVILVCEFVTKIVYKFFSSRFKESRFVGTTVLLTGLILLGVFYYSKEIPDKILPLVAISQIGTNVGTNDSVASSIIAVQSDSSFESSILTDPYRVNVVVKKGDSLDGILNNLEISNDSRRQKLFRDLKKKFNPHNVFVGQKMIVDIVGGYSKKNKTNIENIKFILDAEKSVIASWDSVSAKYIVKVEKNILKESIKVASGVISSSLYQAMEKQGVKRGVIVSFLNLFSFDVDFQRDIHKGDSFDIMFSEFKNSDGAYVRSGDIQMAELSVQGVRKRYYKYTNKNGRDDYYDYKGKSGRKSLIKTPIERARLSSSFGPRKHPVLGYTKVHKGTDFAAPRGTPIFAAGDGMVERAGRNGSFGIYIKIRHNSVYKTAYAHMSGIASGVRTGKRVRQGQVIGYVGTTGRSTGNHLHFEVYKNGKAINSRRMKLPSGEKLTGSELGKFRKAIAPLMKNGI